MISFIKSGNLTYVAAILVMIIMPIYYRYLPPFMVLLGIGWLFEKRKFSRNSNETYPEYKILFFLFLAFFLWQVITILYTSNKELGWSNLFGRLSLLVFPLILYAPSEKIVSNRKTLLRVFALSTILYMVSCFLYALIRSFSNVEGELVFNPHPAEYSWLNYFYAGDLTYMIHPTYMAMYVLMSAFISFHTSAEKNKKPFYRILWFTGGLFLLSCIYFISSRAGLLAALIMIIFYSVTRIVTAKRSRLLWAGILLILIMLVPLVRYNYRVSLLLKGFSYENFRLTDQDERLIVWKSALQLINRNIISGYGVGDVRDELTAEYLKTGQKKIWNDQLNAHNQYFENFLEGGIAEILIFLFLLSFMIFIAVKESNILYALFIVMMIVFFTFETILYRLAGISFFSLFSFILLKYQRKS